MNFQETLIAASSHLRTRAAVLMAAAFGAARTRAHLATQRAKGRKAALATLSIAGRELNEVAQRHALRFVQENSALAIAAGKDFSALARSTYASLSGRKAPARSRKVRAAATRKRATARAA